MLFSVVARIVAVLGLIFAVICLVGGFAIASNWMGDPAEALHRYFPGAATSGAVIDRGIYNLLAALALGTVAEISLGVRRLRQA